jgi:hypothetical protein
MGGNRRSGERLADFSRQSAAMCRRGNDLVRNVGSRLPAAAKIRAAHGGPFTPEFRASPEHRRALKGVE